MTRTLFNIEPLIPLIEAEQLILTPNNRLRNNIRLAYCAHRDQVDSKRNVVPSPRVLSYREWQTQTWQSLQDSGYQPSLCNLANSTVIDTLWQQVLDEAGLEQTGVRSTLERRALAKQAQQAHATLLAWRIAPDDNKGLSQDFDPEILSWCAAFEEKIKQHRIVTEEIAQGILLQAFSEGVLTPENDLYLHSFVDITPLSQALISAAATNHHRLQSNNQPLQKCLKTVAEDQHQEFTQAANWAWKILQEKPDATIAIIAPQLARDRDKIERHFCEVFESHYYDPQQLRTALPFNISAAQNLAQTQVIANTLQLLDFNRPRLTLDQAFTILNSPFFGSQQDEMGLRAKIIQGLKKTGSFTCSPSEIAQLASIACTQQASFIDNAEQDRNFSWQKTSKALFSFIEIRRREKTKQLPSQWVDVFIQQLQTLSWPGDRRIDSVEFQQMKYWYQLLEDFAGLDCLDIQLSLQEALSKLRELANNTPFQTETRDTPIHIVGAFEAVGLQFSHCWILGLNDKEWPAPLRPNPLLPKRLQFVEKMPKASLEREIELAQALTHYFLQAAPECVISYSKQVGHGQGNISSLVSDIKGKEIKGVELSQLVHTLPPGLNTLNSEAKQTEWVHCEKGPALQSSADEPARGGQNIFKQQALCPFNAFAQLRLNAIEPDPPSLGLNPADRGNVIHNALAVLWESITSHTNLIAYSSGQLYKKIEAAVKGCFQSIRKKDVLLLGEHYYQLEQQRIIILLQNWLDQEKKRPPFTVIGTEEELKTEFQGIHLSMRVDRIDQLESGEILLLDYKTSSQTPATWLQQRPTEPQLPLYSLCYPAEVAGISFATVNSEDMGLRGVADNAEQLGINGIKSTAKVAKIESWPALKSLFESSLRQLAEEILQGDCQVMFQGGQYQQDRDPLASLNRYTEIDYIDYRWAQKQ